jgi:hypothetical protein
LLHQPQSVAQPLAGILVAAGTHQPLDHPGLLFGQHNIAREHRALLPGMAALADHAITPNAPQVPPRNVPQPNAPPESTRHAGFL